MPRRSFAIALLLFAAPLAPAGLYTPDEPCPFDIRPDGTAAPLPLTQFLILYNDAAAGQFPIDPNNPGTFDWVPTDGGGGLKALPGGVLSQRLVARHPKAAQLTGPDLAAHTATLIRLGGHIRAIERLTPEARSRTPNYLLLANLAHAHALASGTPADWQTALSRFADALDCDPPAPPPGTSPEQLKWQMRVDRTHYRLWLRLRKEEAEKRPPVPTQPPDAVFETADRQPIRFWEGEAEAAKLPPDAVAVAQQLALWSPGDVKLLWTLGEVYLASGDVRAAVKLYEMCADGRKFGGPTVFRDNRARALDLFAKLPPDTPAAPPGDQDGGLFALVDRNTFYVVGGLFALAAAVMLVLQGWSLAKRLSRGRQA